MGASFFVALLQLILFVDIGDQLSRLTIQEFTQPAECLGGYGQVVPDSMQCFGIYTLVCQKIIGDVFFCHVVPHGLKCNRHALTPFCLGCFLVRQIDQIIRAGLEHTGKSP